MSLKYLVVSEVLHLWEATSDSNFDEKRAGLEGTWSSEFLTALVSKRYTL